MNETPVPVPATDRIVPITQLGGRLPVAGKLRLGVKAGRGMKSIDTFRLTSKHQDLIEAAADIYGAKEGPRPWSDPAASPKDQFEVITKASSIRVFLPHDALSVWYELWSGGGVQRRCDGIESQQIRTAAEGAEMALVPCICQREQRLSCKPTSRLNVVLPDLRFAGTWLLESKGWNAMQELAGMETMVTELQTRVGVVEAQLSIERVDRMMGGRKYRYVVPKLELSHSVVELMSGAAHVRALTEAEPARPELAPPPKATLAAVPDAGGADWFDDDEVVDAEIVDGPEPQPEATTEPEPAPEPEPTAEPDEPDELLATAAGMANELVETAEWASHLTPGVLLAGFISWASRARKTKWAELTERQKMAVVNAAKDAQLGRVLVTWTDNGPMFKKAPRP